MLVEANIKAMGGGGGGGRRPGRRVGTGGGGGGGGELPECGEIHENCSDKSSDSYCNRELGHSGEHRCKSCTKDF